MTTSMKNLPYTTDIMQAVRQDIHLQLDRLHALFDQSPLWSQVGKTGSEVWMDSGDLGAIEEHWVRQFSAVTINNTLLSREICKGTYDNLIAKLAQLEGISEVQPVLVQDIAGLLNVHHGLRLVAKFDAHVSLEAHTALAHNVEGTIDYAQRAYAMCPERFYIKIPWTPAGLLATRQLSRDGIPVNLTLGFSARQNYVATRLARPAFVNVFLGRLNSFIADNDLGTGQYIGENATLASQKMVRALRGQEQVATRQIAASFRDAMQVNDLTGIDVLTIPPRVVADYVAMQVGLDQIVDRTNWEYIPELKEGIDPEALRLDTLWAVDDKVIACTDKLCQENLDVFTPQDLVVFAQKEGCGDLFVDWSDSERQVSREEGKIPRFEHWRTGLSRRIIGLDSLMNLAALNAFVSDQEEMDQHIARVLQRTQ